MAYLLDRTTREWVELPFLDFGCAGANRLERRFPNFASMLRQLCFVDETTESK
jgi:hypothetical protein